MKNLTVIISGGFSLAYHKVLPEFERSTGIAAAICASGMLPVHIRRNN